MAGLMACSWVIQMSAVAGAAAGQLRKRWSCCWGHELHAVVQGLTEAAGSDVRVSFTPHLMPIARGMQSTIYVKLEQGATAADLRSHLQVRAAIAVLYYPLAPRLPTCTMTAIHKRELLVCFMPTAHR